MPSLKDIREFLEMGWFPALVGLIATSTIIAAEVLKVPYFSGLPPLVLQLTAAVCILCFSLVLANTFRLPVYLFKVYRSRKRAANLRKFVVKNLYEANDPERYALAFMFTTNQRVFHAPFDTPLANTLKAKRLISIHSGMHSLHLWPFSVADAAWEEMEANAASWTIPKDQLGEYPFPRF